MKLGDNGEAFFVEETEEEYVSPGWSHSLYTVCLCLWCMPPNRNVQFSWLIVQMVIADLGNLQFQVERTKLSDRRWESEELFFMPGSEHGENAEGLCICFFCLKKKKKRNIFL